MSLLPLVVVLAGVFGPDPLLAGNPYVLKGHTGTVLAVALSPDGHTAASASRDGTVRLWDLATGETTRTIAGAEQQLSVLAFSPDGALLAIGETALKLRVVAVADGAVRQTLAHPDSVSDLAFSPDGALLAVAGHGNNGSIFKVGVDQPLASFRGRTARFSKDGVTLLVANGAGVLSLVEARTGRVRKSLKTEPYLPYATWAGDLVATWNGAEVDVRTWSATTLKAGPVLKGPNPEDQSLKRARVLSVVLDPDAKHFLALSSDGLVRQWDVVKGAPTRAWPTDAASAVATSPGWVAIADGAVIKLWKR